MYVSDLRHFLDLPDDVPGPAIRMAERLGNIVRAASSAEAGTAWQSALGCARRPARRPCTGHLALLRTDVPAEIHWRCTSCGDDGVIHGWQHSYFDLRGASAERGSADVATVVVGDDVAAALRGLRMLDVDCERLVFRARVEGAGVVLSGALDDLDELIDSLAAEANNEPNRRRQARLDAAYTALSEALRTLGS